MRRILTMLAIALPVFAAPMSAHADFTKTSKTGDMSFVTILDTIYNGGVSTFVGAAYGGTVYTSGIGITIRRVDDFGSPGGTLNILAGYGNTAGAGTSSGLDQTWDDGIAVISGEAKFTRADLAFGYSDVAGYHELFEVTESGFLDPGSVMFELDLTDKEWTWDGSIANGNETLGAGSWSSVESANADGLDHMIAYEVIGLGPESIWLLFWEFDEAGGENDFNDLVVQVNATAHVPAPGALALAVMGLGFVAWMKRRRGIA